LQLGKSSEYKKSLLLQADLRNPCAYEKIRRIYRILALMKNQADLQNPCTLQKIRRIYKIPVFYRKTGGQ
jgi:hypothetical protein